MSRLFSGRRLDETMSEAASRRLEPAPAARFPLTGSLEKGRKKCSSVK